MVSNLRERVIRAAVDRIATDGPDGLSFRQIAADVGVTHQAPYHHFRERAAIFEAIALEGFRQFTQELRAPSSSTDRVDFAAELCERYVEFAIRNKGYFRVMFRSDLCRMNQNLELQEAADEAFQTLLDSVSHILGESASVDDIRIQATTMWSVAHGLATLLNDGPLEIKIGEIVDRRDLVRSVARRLAEGFPTSD